MKFKKTIITASATLALAGAGLGTAFAVWSANGAGAAAGAARIAQSLTVTAVSPSAASGESLYPGGPAGWVYVTITNPNPYPVNVTGFQWGTPVSTNPTTCPNADISLDTGAPTTANLAIPANGSLSNVQINGVLDMSHAAPDGCQGVVFDIPLTVTGVQQ